MKNPFSLQTYTESKLKLMISVGTSERYLYVSIIILRFTALILASFFSTLNVPFYFYLFFLPSSVLYRSIGLFGRFFVLLSFSCFIDKHSLRFIVFYSTKHCWVLSRFDCSLVFFVPFQFNGYFLLFTVRTLQIVTYFHRNGEKKHKN